jgi:hypothetical protein
MMKISFLAFPAFLSAVSASIEEIRAERHLSKAFLQAMHSSHTVAKVQQKERAEKIRKLNDNLIKASRKLEYQNQNKYSNYEQQAYAGYQEGQAYSDLGTWNGEHWEFNGEVPFDLNSRAFKYSGCAAIKSFDAERATENGNPMVIDTFAVFRLCPADKCNKYSLTGCSKNYGEYAVEMKVRRLPYLSFLGSSIHLPA